MTYATEVFKDVRRDGDTTAHVIRIQNTGAADTAYPLNHGLGRIPVGCEIILSDRDCRVYKGSRWTAEVVDMKFTAANADVNIRIW